MNLIPFIRFGASGKEWTDSVPAFVKVFFFFLFFLIMNQFTTIFYLQNAWVLVNVSLFWEMGPLSLCQKIRLLTLIHQTLSSVYLFISGKAHNTMSPEPRGLRYGICFPIAIIIPTFYMKNCGLDRSIPFESPIVK